MRRRESAIIMRQRHFVTLIDYLFSTHEVESGVMAFYNYSKSEKCVKLLVKALMIPRDEDYLTRSAGEVAYTPAFGELCHQLCEQNKWNLLDIHTHPHSKNVAFSPIDDAEMIDTKVPYLEKYVPKVGIAFLVLGEKLDIMAARYWDFTRKTSVSIDYVVIL
jgi:hypothetical protein